MQNNKEKLEWFYNNKKRMPSYSEMVTLFGYKTKSAVDYALRKLISDGVISKDKKGKLIPNKLHSEIKLLGLISAGFPSPAEEELVDTMSLDDFLIQNKNSSYLLRVKGDSMIDAGIMEGDMVIVERGKTPRVGDIVIAQVDGEYTMKYYRTKDGRIYLEPANKKYKLIIPTSELKMEAVVTAVIRKY